MIRTIRKIKIIFSLVLFLYTVFILNGSTFAEEITVTCYPKNYTIHNYKGCASGYPTATLDGTKNIGSNDIDEVWYYAIPNYKNESIDVDFKLYGPVTIYGEKTYVKNLLVDFTDKIPANTIRMYFYTVFTADKSYEASEVHSVDIALNTSKEITGTPSNFRSLVAVSMGDDGDNKVDVKYYLSKEEIEDTGLNPSPQHYGYAYNSTNPHYIQFLYPNASRTITLHSFVQSGARPIGTPVGSRAYIVSQLSGFNGREVYTIYSSTSNTHYYSNAVTVNSQGRSDVSREPLGHLVITYDKQDKAPDTTPPTATLYTDVTITNQNTIRVYLNAKDEESGLDLDKTKINGFFGQTGEASCYTGRNYFTL